MTKLKNSNCDKTQIVTKNQIVTKLNGKKKNFKMWQYSNCEKKLKNSNYDNSRPPIVTKLENSNFKFQFMKKTTLKWSLSKNILTPWQVMRCSLGSVLRFLDFFYLPFKEALITLPNPPIHNLPLYMAVTIEPIMLTKIWTLRLSFKLALSAKAWQRFHNF